MKSTLILLFLFSYSAKAVDRCEQIPSLTCAPGTLNDGTASVSVTPSVEEKMLGILNEKKPKIYEDFLRNLATAQPYEVQYALSATGAGATEECESVLAGGEMTQPCRQLVATGLTDRVLVDLRSGSDSEENQQRLAGALEDEYPLRQTALYQNTLERFNEQLANEMGRPQVEQRLREEIFPKTLSYLKDVISKNVPDPAARQKLLTKISAIRFAGMDCSQNSSGGLYSEFESNAFYDGVANQFFFCKGYEKFGLSDFNAVHTIAHELAHSIDPCNIQTGPSFFRFNYQGTNPQELEAQYPFPNLIACLRDSRSVGANAGGQNTSTDDPMAMPDPSSEPDPSPSFCTEGEQIGESFCDWIGTEVLTRFAQNEWKKLSQRQFQNGVANIWRSACQPGAGINSSPTQGEHPPTGLRLTKLILTHPYIRQRLDCGEMNPSRDIYCNADYASPSQSEYDEGTEPSEEEESEM